MAKLRNSGHPLKSAAALGILLGIFTAPAEATVLGASWNGSTNTLWTNGTNWGFADVDQFPRNGNPPPEPGEDENEYNVEIQSSGPVRLDQGTSVLNVTIASGQSLTLAFDEDTGTTGSLTLDGDGLNGGAGRGGRLANNGTIVLDNDGSDTRNRTLRIRDGDMQILGSGLIDMRDSAQNRILGGGDAGTVSHSAGHTIRGAGVVGNHGFDLQNSGTIEGTQSGNALVLNTRGGDNTNNGTIGARNGGTLRIDGSIIDNTGGVIQALSNSTVELRSQASATDNESTHITGGTLRTENNGLITTVFNSAIIEDVTIENGSQVQVANGTSLNARGTITNDGQVIVADTGGSTTLTIGSQPTTFTGGGEILMHSDSNTLARIRGQTSGADAPADATLVNDSDHQIRGAGTVGLNTILLDNRGTIRADQDGKALTINTKGLGPGNFNTGTMEAVGGGILDILGSTIDNTGGRIEAHAGSTVDLNRRNSSQESAETRIIGGTLAGFGDGIIRTSTRVALDGTTIADGTVFNIENNSVAFLSGTTTNNGTVTTQANGALTQVQIDGDATLEGTGTLVMETERSRIRTASVNGSLLTNGAGHTIRGAGTVGFSTISILNQGTIIADGTDALTIDPTNNAGGHFTNEGHLIARGTGGIDIVQIGSAFETRGTVAVEDGSIIDVNGTYRQTGGATTLIGANSELEATTVLLEGGTIGGTGTIDANLVNSGGTLGPGLSPGIFNIEGSFDQTDDGTFVVEIFNAVVFDQLFATGNGQLAGTLQIDLLPGANFDSGETFAILNFNDNASQSLFGEFTRVTGSGASFFDLEFGLDGLTLIANQSFAGATSVPEPGSMALLLLGIVGAIAARHRVR